MDYPKVLTKYYIDKEWTCGDTYETIVWYEKTEPKPTEEELELKYDDLLLDEMREERDKLLRETDYTALPDYPQRDKWIVYRQELRDFPSVWTPETPFPTSPID